MSDLIETGTEFASDLLQEARDASVGAIKVASIVIVTLASVVVVSDVVARVKVRRIKKAVVPTPAVVKEN